MVIRPRLAPGRRTVVVALTARWPACAPHRHPRTGSTPYPAPGQRCHMANMVPTGQRARGRDMGVLLHISDTHFGAEQAPVVEALVALAAQQRPMWWCCRATSPSGRGPPVPGGQGLCRTVGAPVLAIPGNHDIALFDLWARLTPAPTHGFQRCSNRPGTRACLARLAGGGGQHHPCAAAQARRGVGGANRARDPPVGERQPRQLRGGGGASARGRATGQRAAQSCCVAMRSHTGLGRRRCRPCWAATSTCFTCRWTDWRGGCGRCRRARLFQRARGLGC